MNRSIYITRDITKDGATEITQAIKYFEEQGNDPIRFYINCYGGSVPALLTILDAMENCKCEIITVNIGEADSAAALIFAAGTKGKRFITKNSRIMLHEIMCNWMLEGEPLSRIEAQLKEFQILQDRIWRELANFTGKSVEDVKKDCLGKDLYLSAEEAISYGLADAVLTQEIKDKYELKKAEIKAAAEGGKPQNKKEQNSMKLEELLKLLKEEHKLDVNAVKEELKNVKASNEKLTQKVDELTAANTELVAEKEEASNAKKAAEETLCSLQKEVYFERLVAEKKELPAQKEAVLSQFKNVEDMKSFYANRPALLNTKPQGSGDADSDNKFDPATNNLVKKGLISKEDAKKYLNEGK